MEQLLNHFSCQEGMIRVMGLSEAKTVPSPGHHSFFFGGQLLAKMN